MSTHKALVLLEPRGTYVVQDVPTPVPGPGQLLVEVKAAALNPVDWKVRDYGAVPVKYPIILGSDAAGIVKEVGEGVTEFKAGDRVCVHHSVLTERLTGLTIYCLVGFTKGTSLELLGLSNNTPSSPRRSLPRCV